jgi:predicted DNA-binding transcriptional regulator AlpA
MHHLDLINEDAARHVIGGADTPISRSAFWRAIKSGRLPGPIKVLPRTNRWNRDDLVAAIRQGGSDAAR